VLECTNSVEYVLHRLETENPIIYIGLIYWVAVEQRVHGRRLESAL